MHPPPIEVIPAAPLILDEGQEVLFVGGFMSELYEELSVNLENEINEALQDAARALNVHIDLPFARDIDIPIGDSIANALPRVDLPIEPGGFVTFYRQMRYFDEQGIAYQNLSVVSEPFDTSASVKHNAAALRSFLESTNKQVIIVSHSKGSLDTLDALLGASELVGTRVIGWVAIQAPFHGSPVADSTFGPLNGFLLEALGGNGQSVEDLKTKVREPYMEANKARIEALMARIPVISAYSTYEASAGVTGFAGTFASSIFDAGLVSEISAIVVRNYRETPREISRVVSASTSAAIRLVRERLAGALHEAMATIGLVDFTNLYMNDVLELPNDGLVPQASTELPGAIPAELATGDHASPVMDVDPYKNHWSAAERNAVTVELIREVWRLTKTATQ
ncbi:MAG: hypothetical protein HKN10_03670 [Myxococcales bacterium]|nr:hypothetical protein [Deltaproteobacteria bacterium]NNE17557.1 hypothetical protein [Myxococcales bacterium]